MKGKTKHFELTHLPKRSTLSDANKLRPVSFFENIYFGLMEQYSYCLSDCRLKELLHKQVKIFDSTTISLFHDVMRCVGRKPKNGKRKGGIKVHTVINADEKVPEIIWHTEATTHDHCLLSQLKLDENTIYVFDKGYNDYEAFLRFTHSHTGFVTRQKENVMYSSIEEIEIGDEIHDGVLKDERIEIIVKKENGTQEALQLRRVAFWDDENKQIFVFLTNLFELRADLIAELYKIRWQIELLFKQLNQNFPLKYFLGDNENAIKIQIWCALIVNLLLSVIQKMVQNKKWAFSGLVSFCRLHLFNYIHLIKFLNDPNKDWVRNTKLKPPNLFGGDLLFEINTC